MALKVKKLSKEEVKYANMLNRIYNTLALQKAKWTCNLNNGKNINSDQYPDFTSVSFNIRRKIRTFRFHIWGKKYTINTKVKVLEQTKYLKGFFYHILAGHETVIGELPISIPYVEERAGFCYNRNGDALCVYISHYNFLKQIHKRREQVKLLFGEYKPYQELYPQDEKGKDSKRMIYVPHTKFQYTKEVHDIISAPLQYDTQINSYMENINGQEFFLDGTPVPVGETPKRSVKVNIARFGSLENLEDSTTPPRFFENNQEIVVPLASI